MAPPPAMRIVKEWVTEYRTCLGLYRSGALGKRAEDVEEQHLKFRPEVKYKRVTGGRSRGEASSAGGDPASTNEEDARQIEKATAPEGTPDAVPLQSRDQCLAKTKQATGELQFLMFDQIPVLNEQKSLQTKQRQLLDQQYEVADKKRQLLLEKHQLLEEGKFFGLQKRRISQQWKLLGADTAELAREVQSALVEDEQLGRRGDDLEHQANKKMIGVLQMEIEEREMEIRELQGW